MSARLSTALPACLFRRHVCCRAEDDALLRGGIAQRGRVRQVQFCLFPGKRLRQSEVQHLHLAVRRDFDVGRLQVAVDDALLMRGFEGFGDLQGQFQRFLDRDRTGFYPIRQRFAFDQFKDKEVCSAGFFQPVNGGNVRDDSEKRAAWLRAGTGRRGQRPWRTLPAGP